MLFDLGSLRPSKSRAYHKFSQFPATLPCFRAFHDVRVRWQMPQKRNNSYELEEFHHKQPLRKLSLRLAQFRTLSQHSQGPQFHLLLAKRKVDLLTSTALPTFQTLRG